MHHMLARVMRACTHSIHVHTYTYAHIHVRTLLDFFAVRRAYRHRCSYYGVITYAMQCKKTMWYKFKDYAYDSSAYTLSSTAHGVHDIL